MLSVNIIQLIKFPYVFLFTLCQHLILKNGRSHMCILAASTTQFDQLYRIAFGVLG